METKDFFSDKIKYGGNYSIKSTRKFSAEEKAKVVSVSIVDSDYGVSAKFLLRNNRAVYTPLSINSALSIGETVDINSLNIITLSREGDADIERIEEDK